MERVNGIYKFLLIILLQILLTNGESLSNLAFKKRTWQSSTLQIHSSERAVDGLKTDLTAAGFQCAISTRVFDETSVMWLVDLEDVKSINHIKVYYRTEDIAWDSGNVYATRFANFSVYVSNTTGKEQGVLCYHDNIDAGVISSPEMTINCSVPGRYVIYYNERSGSRNDISRHPYLDLCEVEVFGCPYGNYGQNCSESCPNYCQYCDPYSGQCLGGCSPGYFGQHCEHYWRSNLAYKMPTVQTGNSLRDTSGRAVDGRKSDLSEDGEQCVVSGDSSRQTFVYVDLGGVRSIERVLIYLMTGNQEWGPQNKYTSRSLGFSLIISNDTVPNKGEICFHDKEYTTSTIPAVLDITCAMVGRYVFFTNERLERIGYPEGYSAHAYVDVCEMEVYGCPVPGFNGPNCSIPCAAMCEDPCPAPIEEISQCSEPCPTNCEQCYPGTGVCKICKRGYAGDNCEDACHATIPEYSDYPKGAFDVNAFDNIYTSIGLPLRLLQDGFNYWKITIRWRGEPADIARISVTMEFSAQFGIFLKTELGEMIKTGPPFYGNTRDTLTLENPFESRVVQIVLSGKYHTPILLTDFTLELRNCKKVQ